MARLVNTDSNQFITCNVTTVFEDGTTSVRTIAEGDIVEGTVRNRIKTGVFVEIAPNVVGIAEHVNGIEYGQEVLVSIKKINLDKKTDEYNKNRENKENKYQEMNKLQKEINNKMINQKNEINKLKREIKDMDKLIFKEAETYQNTNKKDRELVNQMIINKNKMDSEFMTFLKELEIIETEKLEEQKKNRFKKLIKGQKINYNIISTKKKKSQKNDKKSSSENLLLLEEKLEYYLNNKGEKKELKEVEARRL